MSHRLAGFSIDLIKANQAEYETQFGVPIIIPEEETGAAQYILQQEGDGFCRYRYLKGHFIPALERKSGSSTEEASRHFAEAWKRFERFLSHPLNGNMLNWSLYLREKKNVDVYMLNLLFRELCVRFPCFADFKSWPSDEHNVILLFRQAIPSDLEFTDIIPDRPRAYTHLDMTIRKGADAEAIAEKIVQGSSTQPQVLRENLIVMMVMNAYLCRTYIKTCDGQGKPGEFTEFIFNILHHTIVKLAAVRNQHDIFGDDYMHIEDFSDAFAEIRSEVQKSAAIAVAGGKKKMLSPEKIDFNKSVKAGEVCQCIDQLRGFILDNVISRLRLQFGARPAFDKMESDNLRSSFRQLCVYANRAASFPPGGIQSHAMQQYYEYKEICSNYMGRMPKKDIAMYTRAMQITEFMISTEYKMEKSVESLCNAYKINMTARLKTVDGSSPCGPS